MALTDNLVHYWKLDEASGNASDSVGSATLTNTNVTYAAAKINNGAIFNSTSDKLEGTISSGLSGSFTISLWCYLANTTNEIGLVESHVASYNNYWIYFGAVTARLALYDGTNNPYVDIPGGIGTGAWHFVIARRDTGTDKIGISYDGGAFTEATDTTTSTPTYSGFTVGNRFNALGSISNHDIDEVGVWSRALSLTEVGQLYNSGAGLQYPFSSGGGVPIIKPNLLTLGVG